MPQSDTHGNVDGVFHRTKGRPIITSYVIKEENPNGSSERNDSHSATKKEVVTILRAVHKYKDSREQFERRTHKRLIDVVKPSAKTVEALMSLDLPAGVDIEIKL